MISPSVELATQSLRLRFFDLDTNIQSDSGAYLDLFDQLYQRFRTNLVPQPTQQQLDFTILTQPDNPWGEPLMNLDGDLWPVNDARLLTGYTYEAVLKTILARIQSHLLIHAGVVAWDGQGIIVAADSGHGKTTLVLELVRRGFKFLSDEMAALGQDDHHVHPFPRSLRIRPGSLELAGFPEAAIGAPMWLGKQILDIEQIHPGAVGASVPLQHIIILQNSNQVREESSGTTEEELSILVNRLDGELLSSIRQFDDVTDICTNTERGYPLLTLRTGRPTRLFAQIEDLCHARHILILDVINRAADVPAFIGPARLEAIPKSQAIVALLRQFLGGYRSVILQDEFGGNSTRLFMELATIIGVANCYRLTPGPLHGMADLVCDLI